MKFTLESDEMNKPAPTLNEDVITALETNNQTSLLLLFVQSGLGINDPVTEAGETALMIAVQRPTTDLAEFLIKLGADINQCDANNQSVLAKAIHSNRQECVALLISKNVSCYYEVKDQEVSILVENHRVISLPILKMLLDYQFPDPVYDENHRPHPKITPLACAYVNSTDHFAQILAKIEGRYTLQEILTEVIKHNAVESCELLLEKCDHDLSKLHWYDFTVEDQYLAYYFNIDVKNVSTRYFVTHTAFTYAISRGSYQVLQVLCRSSWEDINKCATMLENNYNGRHIGRTTPINIAVSREDHALLDILLSSVVLNLDYCESSDGVFDSRPFDIAMKLKDQSAMLKLVLHDNFKPERIQSDHFDDGFFEQVIQARRTLNKARQLTQNNPTQASRLFQTALRLCPTVFFNHVAATLIRKDHQYRTALMTIMLGLKSDAIRFREANECVGVYIDQHRDEFEQWQKLAVLFLIRAELNRDVSLLLLNNYHLIEGKNFTLSQDTFYERLNNDPACKEVALRAHIAVRLFAYKFSGKCKAITPDMLTMVQDKVTDPIQFIELVVDMSIHTGKELSVDAIYRDFLALDKPRIDAKQLGQSMSTVLASPARDELNTKLDDAHSLCKI